MNAEPVAVRTLQPSAWRRAIGVLLVAVIVLSVLLQEPVAALLPDATPRWVLFLAIAAPISGALVLGLSIAYPRVLMGADGSLRVGGRVVPKGDVVGLRRSVSRGPSAGYLVYTLATRAGRPIRVLVAGAPIRGLGIEQLGMLREVVAASGIPVAADPTDVERTIIGQNLLADGRRAEVDRGFALRELDRLRGVPYRPVAGTPVGEADVGAGALVGRGVIAEDEPAIPEGWAAAAHADDSDAARELDAATRGTRMLRRVALGLFVVVCLVAIALLVVLAVREAAGAWIGDASDDPLVAAMAAVLGVTLVTGVVWALGADIDDARSREVSRRWLAAASEAQRERGLPSGFHAAWMRLPGGRLTGLGLFVFGMTAMVTVIGGPVALFGGFGQPLVGGVVTVVGVVLSGLALWGWYARRRSHARRIEWLLEVAGERVHGGDAPSR